VNGQGKFGGGNGDGYTSQTIINIVLPLQQINVQAKYQENGTVQINWSTTNESGIAAFEVQRSVNGTDWKTIATEKSKSVAGSQTNYNAIDGDPQQGTSFYRIKIIELSGSFSFSAIVNIRVNKGYSFSLYPNPAKQELFINITDRNKGLAITDASGRIVLQYSAVPQKININHLEPGIYFIRIGTEVMQVLKH
jgi:hypothetical protein